MAREDLHFRLRIPASLKDQIHACALANSRSMTAEIVSRLSGDRQNLRDQFAGQALVGMLSNPAGVSWGSGALISDEGAIAKAAFYVADAMLSARDGAK